MTHPDLIERITRSLAYMLRHQPEQFDLELDEYGFADLDDVVQALNERLGDPVEPDDVRVAVESGDRIRYDITDNRIRALYGHSIDVKPGEPNAPPERLYVGVARHDAERALRFGLRPGRRRYLHLALSSEEALETVQRTEPDFAVLVVHAHEAWEGGVSFWDRGALYLSDPIPTQFLEVEGGAGRGAPMERAPAHAEHGFGDDGEGEGDEAPVEAGESGSHGHELRPAAPREGERGGRRRRGRRGQGGGGGGGHPGGGHSGGGHSGGGHGAGHGGGDRPAYGGRGDAHAPRRDAPLPASRGDAPRDAGYREAGPRDAGPRHAGGREPARHRESSPEGHGEPRHAHAEGPRGGRGHDERHEPRGYAASPSGRSDRPDRPGRSDGPRHDDRGRAPERHAGPDTRAPRDSARGGDDRRPVPRHDAPRHDAPRHDAPRGDDRRYDEPRRDEPRRDEPRRDEPRRDAPRRDEARRDEPRRDEPRREESRRDAPRRDDFRRDEPRRDEPRRDEPRRDEPRRDEPRRDEPRRDERPRDEAPRRAPAREHGGGFGLGVDDAQQQAPAPRREAPPPPPAPRPEPRRAQAPARRDDDTGGFGAGL